MNRDDRDISADDLLAELDRIRVCAQAGRIVAKGGQLSEAIAMVTLAIAAMDQIDDAAADLFDLALEGVTTGEAEASALIVSLAALVASVLKRHAEIAGVRPAEMLRSVAEWHALRQVGVIRPPDNDA